MILTLQCCTQICSEIGQFIRFGKQRNPRATLVTISMELSQRRNPGDAPCHSCNRNRERGTGLIETVWLRIRPTLNEHWDNGDMVNAHVFWSTYQATV